MARREAGLTDERVRLEVEDDGIGLRAGRLSGASGGGVGLIGIRERVRALGGTLHLGPGNAGPGPGARLEAWLPLQLER